MDEEEEEARAEGGQGRRAGARKKGGMREGWGLASPTSAYPFLNSPTPPSLRTSPQVLPPPVLNGGQGDMVCRDEGQGSGNGTQMHDNRKACLLV